MEMVALCAGLISAGIFGITLAILVGSAIEKGEKVSDESILVVTVIHLIAVCLIVVSSFFVIE